MIPIRKIFFAAALIALLVLSWVVVFYMAGGVTNRDILGAVREESADIKQRLDARADELSEKLDASGARLERIESKLDRLLDIASHPLSDKLGRVE